MILSPFACQSGIGEMQESLSIGLWTTVLSSFIRSAWWNMEDSNKSRHVVCLSKG